MIKGLIRVRKKLIYIVIIFLSITSAKAQDVIFSQFFANKIHLNPAFAGNPEQREIFSGYRNQWPGFNNAYNTYSFSYNQYVKVMHGGLGLNLVNDMQAQAGIFNLSLSGVYSYHIQINRVSQLRLGLNAGIINNAFLTNKFEFPSMVDPSINGSGPGLAPSMDLFADFSTGAVYIYKNWHVGFSANHLFKFPVVNATNIELPMKFTFHLVGSFDYNPYRLVKPMFVFYPVLLVQQQGDNMQINYGTYVEKNPITLGVWFKQNLLFDYYSATFLLGIKFKNYNIAYSYDVYIMNKQSAGLITSAHEVTFLYKLGYKEKVAKIRAIKCPEF